MRLAGASVFHGIEGFGPSHRIHAAHLMHLREERPIAITIIDSADRIHAFISEINELITRGLIVTDPVDVVLYTDQPDSELTAPMTLHGRPVMAPVSVRTRGANRRRLAATPGQKPKDSRMRPTSGGRE